jgi:hypothetical protein
MKNEKCCSQLSTYSKKDAWDLGARGLSDCAGGQLERLKPCNIVRLASAGRRRPSISASDRGRNCCSDFFLFMSTAYIINFSIYLFSLFVF